MEAAERRNVARRRVMSLDRSQYSMRRELISDARHSHSPQSLACGVKGDSDVLEFRAKRSLSVRRSDASCILLCNIAASGPQTIGCECLPAAGSAKKSATPGGCAEFPPKEEVLEECADTRASIDTTSLCHYTDARRKPFLLPCNIDLCSRTARKTKSNERFSERLGQARARASVPCAFHCRGARRRDLCGHVKS
jgi:hypothetical protein